jgi:hypothetical protein
MILTSSIPSGMFGELNLPLVQGRNNVTYRFQVIKIIVIMRCYNGFNQGKMTNCVRSNYTLVKAQITCEEDSRSELGCGACFGPGVTVRKQSS